MPKPRFEVSLGGHKNGDSCGTPHAEPSFADEEKVATADKLARAFHAECEARRRVMLKGRDTLRKTLSKLQALSPHSQTRAARISELDKLRGQNIVLSNLLVDQAAAFEEEKRRMKREATVAHDVEGLCGGLSTEDRLRERKVETVPKKELEDVRLRVQARLAHKLDFARVSQQSLLSPPPPTPPANSSKSHDGRVLQLKQEIEVLRTRNADQEQLKKIVAKLKSERDEAQAECKRLTEEHQDESIVLKKETAMLRTENQSLAAEIDEYHGYLRELENVFAELKYTIGCLKDAYKDDIPCAAALSKELVEVRSMKTRLSVALENISFLSSGNNTQAFYPRLCPHPLLSPHIQTVLASAPTMSASETMPSETLPVMTRRGHRKSVSEGGVAMGHRRMSATMLLQQLRKEEKDAVSKEDSANEADFDDCLDETIDEVVDEEIGASDDSDFESDDEAPSGALTDVKSAPRSAPKKAPDSVETFLNRYSATVQRAVKRDGTNAAAVRLRQRVSFHSQLELFARVIC